MEILNQVFQAFLSALGGGTEILAEFALPILAFTALCWMGWSLATTLASGGGHAGETLTSLVFKLITVGLYMWILTHWSELTTAFLETMLMFAMRLEGVGESARRLLTEPGVIWQIGQATIKPLIDFDSWQRGVATTFNLMVNPLDILTIIAVLAAFLGMTIAHGAMLIEFYLAVLVGVVMLPWSLLRPVGHLGEFAAGWITGCCIRILVSCLVVGLSFLLFPLLQPPATGPASTGFIDYLTGLVMPTHAPTFAQTFKLLVGSLVFLGLCLVIPNRAARLAGAPALALGGSDLFAGAMAMGQWGQGALRFGTAAARGSSRLVAGMRG